MDAATEAIEAQTQARTALPAGRPQAESKGNKRRRRRLGAAARWIALAGAVLLAWPLRPDSWEGTSLLLPAASPLVGIGGPLAARTAGPLLALAVPALILAWRAPRGICRYGCPTGALLELVARLRPDSAGPWRRFPRLGGWIAAATMGGAAAGFPLALWLDPLALFNGGLNAWRVPLTWGAVAAGSGLFVLLLVELAAPHLWCRRLCPLGGLQDGCTQCRRGMTVLRAPGGREGVRRNGRRFFLATCGGAAGAVIVQRARGGEGRNRPWGGSVGENGRHGGLGEADRAAGEAGGGRGGQGRAGTSEEGNAPLRPPGALGEDAFTGVCVRCGNCAQVCPTHIIGPTFSGSIEGWLAPRLDFSEGYCREDCRRCGQVCPSGALQRLTLAQKRESRIGLARIDTTTCLMAAGRECNACLQACPYEALAIAQGADGFTVEPRVDATRCNGCGACETACPVTPLKAARIIRRGA